MQISLFGAFPLQRRTVTACAVRAYQLGCALALIACGSSSSAPRTADESSSEVDDSAPEDPAEEQSEEDAAPEASGPDCSDGTCFSCGDGLCPSGFYCDEQAKGGAACSWLPECADTASCSCVQKVLGTACSCSDSDGGPRVTCN